MGELGALFNPGMRHELEERRARAARREEEGNARDGDLRIDLESGVAVINAPGDDDAAADHDDASTADALDSDARKTGSARSGSAQSDAVGSGSAGSEPAAEADSAESAESGVSKPPLRPRGKRAMSAARR